MKKIYILIGLLFSLSLVSQAQTFNITSSTPNNTSQTFTANGVVNVAAGVTVNVTVELWGAGAAGIGSAGGNGGGYSITTTPISLSGGAAGTDYTVTVGAGGVVGGSGPTSTSFQGVSLAGGGGASGDAGNNNAGGGGGEGGCATGTASVGGTPVPNGSTPGAGGSGCDGGDGGTGGDNSGTNGTNGLAPGGGGGGKGKGATPVAGNGGAGQVRITVSSTPLPVTLTYFSVKSSQLLWQTAMELNNDRFEIERLLEGENEFTQIGEVIGAGNSNSLVDYSFSDESAVPAGNHCYRLKQVDFDGQYEYSEVQCVLLKGEKTASIYPNPFTNEIIITDYATETASEVEVTDLQGNVLIKASLDSDVKHISAADLAPGTYFVRVAGTVKKMVKY